MKETFNINTRLYQNILIVISTTMRKYLVKQFMYKSQPQLTLGIQQRQPQQNLNINPLIYISIRADIKILKQIIQITLNNPQICLESSVDLNASKVVLKQQIFLYNEDSKSFDKINKFKEDVDFKKMEGESYYKRNIEKTKTIRKQYLQTYKFNTEKRGLTTKINQLISINSSLFLEKEKFKRQLLTANKLSNSRQNKNMAQYESKLKDLKNEITALHNRIQQMKISYSKLSNHLNQSILKKDYDHMKSTLQNQIQAKQSIFSTMIILKKKLQEYQKR